MVPIEASEWKVNGKKIVVVSPKGYMDQKDEVRFISFLETGFNQGPDILIIDLTLCPNISETTRDILKDKLTEQGREGIMVFAGSNSAIREAMIPRKIEALFSAFPTVADAFSAFAPPKPLHI